MRIPLERHSSKVVYLQIRDRIRHPIETGALQAKDKLPSIRSLAQSIGVNLLTVIEAYNVLETDGLIEARGGLNFEPVPAPIKALDRNDLVLTTS